MKETINFAIKAIECECEKFQKKDDTIYFNKDKSEEFETIFRDIYNNVMERFMKDTSELDSHKQAAIITISCLKSGIVSASCEKDKITIAPQLIAITVALSYMNDILNFKLKKLYLNEKIEKYSLPKKNFLPEAIACDTPYIEIMCRILYYEQTEDDMDFNVLELADRYFLLEYLNLIQHGIEPLYLKNSKNI